MGPSLSRLHAAGEWTESLQRCDRRSQKKKAGPLPRQRDNGKMHTKSEKNENQTQRQQQRRQQRYERRGSRPLEKERKKRKKKGGEREMNKKNEAGKIYVSGRCFSLSPSLSAEQGTSFFSSYSAFLLGRVGRHFVRLAVLFSSLHSSDFLFFFFFAPHFFLQSPPQSGNEMGSKRVNRMRQSERERVKRKRGSVSVRKTRSKRWMVMELKLKIWTIE